ENIDRRAAVPLFQIRPAEPAKRGEAGLIIREWITDKALVAGGRITPLTLPLGELRLLDYCPYSMRFHLV
ncbi:MAG: hypothetical protein ACJ78M_13460, partial [Gemmatimonadaceae bacterium]